MSSDQKDKAAVEATEPSPASTKPTATSESAAYGELYALTVRMERLIRGQKESLNRSDAHDEVDNTWLAAVSLGTWHDQQAELDHLYARAKQLLPVVGGKVANQIALEVRGSAFL